MKTINQHNYELFFIDFLDGNLSKSQITGLNKFLSENPKLKQELETFETIKLEPELIKFEQKDNLIKQTQSQFFEITQFEYLSVAETENEISKTEKAELEKEINKDSSKHKDLKLFKKTKLEADTNIIFINKKLLIRKITPFYIKISSYAAAAIVAMLLILNQDVFQNKLNNSTETKQISSISEKKHNAKQSAHLNLPIIIEKESKQEPEYFHKQTNKEILAFRDKEPQSEINLYKELYVHIPKIKREALISNKPKLEMKEKLSLPVYATNTKIKKVNMWRYAETGLNIWKKISSSDIEMNNRYKENGSIEKLRLYASNVTISKTFNK